MRTSKFLTANSSDSGLAVLLEKIFVSKEVVTQGWYLATANSAAREVKGLKRPASPPERPGQAAKKVGKKICMPFMMHLSGVITSVGSTFNDATATSLRGRVRLAMQALLRSARTQC